MVSSDHSPGSLPDPAAAKENEPVPESLTSRETKQTPPKQHVKETRAGEKGKLQFHQKAQENVEDLFDYTRGNKIHPKQAAIDSQFDVLQIIHWTDHSYGSRRSISLRE